MRSRLALLPLVLPLLLLAACSNTEGGTLEVRVEGASFGPLLETGLGRTDDEGDAIFDLSQDEAPDDSFGFTVIYSRGDDGNYKMQSGAGDPEADGRERVHLELSISPWMGPRSYSTVADDSPEVVFRWWGEYVEDEVTGNGHQPSFVLSSAEGGTCETQVTRFGLDGSFACEGMSAVIDGELEPSGLLEISGTWVGHGNTR